MMKILTCCIIILCQILSLICNAQNPYYSKSYAVIIGNDKYPYSNRYDDLKNALNDAKEIEILLKAKGFQITPLYNKDATKKGIISVLEDRLAQTVRSNDRILVFYSGHGHTERLGGKDRGYIVPYDGTDNLSSYVSMEELQSLSDKMGNAKHQLFIMDCCFGGLLGSKEGGVRTKTPNYLQVVTKRNARQILTAGGKNETVPDGGGGDLSVFTKTLIEAIEEGLADDGDGFITFHELSSYVITKASTSYSTPTSQSFPGHGTGEFVFSSISTKTHSYERREYEGNNKGSRANNPSQIKTLPTSNNTNISTKHTSSFKTLPPAGNKHLSDEYVTRILKLNNLFCMPTTSSNNLGFQGSNENGTGFNNNFSLQASNTIYDRNSGLIWQVSGSERLHIEDAKQYIDELNTVKFEGSSNWRLPSLYEALTLMEPEKNGDGLYIDSKFDSKQSLILTSNYYEQQRTLWCVSYEKGRCHHAFFFSFNRAGSYFVRAVRTFKTK